MEGMGQFLDISDHTYHDLTFKFLYMLYVEVLSEPRCQKGYISFYLNREFCKLNLSAFNSIFGFHRVWTCLIDTSLKNLTRVIFRIKYLGTISMIQATPKAPLFETPVFERSSNCFLVVCLRRRI